jgi:hypothetical protein
LEFDFVIILISCSLTDVDWQCADEWTRSSVIDANLMQWMKISIAVISQTDAAEHNCHQQN